MKRQIIWPMIAGILGAAPLRAAPTVYPESYTQLSNIVNTTDSNLVTDNQDSRVFWVMPPNTEQANVSRIGSLTTNMNFCGEMSDLQSYSREVSKEIADLSKQEIAARTKYQQELAMANKAYEDAAAYASSVNIGQLVSIDQRVRDIDLRIDELYKNLETCSNSCDPINTEISTLSQEKRDLTQTRSRIVRENGETAVKYDRLKKVADSKKASADSNRLAWTDLRKGLISIRDSYLSAYSSYGKMEGGRAILSYSSHWQSNIDKLRSSNPGYSFQKIPTGNVKFMAETALGTVGRPSESIIAYTFPGQSGEGQVVLPSFPEALQGSVTLSLIGACPMVHPDYFDLPDASAVQKYGAILTYDYESVFQAKAEAKYNMYKLYQKIVSSGSSGGFFSSRSWTNVEEKNFFSDSMTITWFDPEGTIPQATKDAMESEMRKAVLTRLAALALPQTPDRQGILTAAGVPKRGAVVLSEQLLNVCPTNIYCVGAAAITSVLDAIFGSSSSTSSYLNIQDVEIKENYMSTQKIYKPWITSTM